MDMKTKYRMFDFLKNLIIILVFILSTNLLITLYIGVTNDQLDLNLVGTVDYFKNKVIAAVPKSEVKVNTEDFQKTPSTSGAAVLRYILYYGSLNIKISEEELAEKLGATREGISLVSMVRTLDELGLQGIQNQLNYEMLKTIPKPFIAYINNNHYIVINEVEDDYIYVFDPNPNYGYMKARKEQFLKIWSGVILQVTTKELSYRGGV